MYNVLCINMYEFIDMYVSLTDFKERKKFSVDYIFYVSILSINLFVGKGILQNACSELVKNVFSVFFLFLPTLY